MTDALRRILEDTGLHRCPHQAEGAIVYYGCPDGWCDARVTANTLRLCDELDAHDGLTKAEHDALAREGQKP